MNDKIKKNKQFYLDLGYTEKQANYLAKTIFGEEIRVDGALPVGRISMSGGGFGGFGGLLQRGFGQNMKSLGSATLDSLDLCEEVCDYTEMARDDDAGFSDIDIECSEAQCLFNGPVGGFEAANEMYAGDIQINYAKPVNKKDGFIEVVDEPTSNIKTTVNTASYSAIRQCVNSRCYINEKIIRVEEIINHFDYELNTGLNYELGEYSDETYLLVGYKAPKAEVPSQNLVLLIDTSGSMGGLTEALQKCIMTAIKQLKDTDTVSLVTYSSTDKVIFENVKASDVDKIIGHLKDININGCTYGSQGLNKAYEIAEKYSVKGGSNRVVIITDGDFNFGIVSEQGISEFIKDKKKSGVFLTVVGLGNNVYDEITMEALARNGNGNYFRIIDDTDILEILKNKFNSNTVAVAKDVKMQVEFNPSVVKKYRLIGYETREISRQEFRDDNVEAEPVGSEHTVIALYNIVKNESGKVDNELKYQQTSNNDELGTIKLRYKLPDEKTSREDSLVINNKVEKIISNNLVIALSAKALYEAFMHRSNNDFDAIDISECNIGHELVRIITKDNSGKSSKLKVLLKLLETITGSNFSSKHKNSISDDEKISVHLMDLGLDKNKIPKECINYFKSSVALNKGDIFFNEMHTEFRSKYRFIALCTEYEHKGFSSGKCRVDYVLIIKTKDNEIINMLTRDKYDLNKLDEIIHDNPFYIVSDIMRDICKNKKE